MKCQAYMLVLAAAVACNNGKAAEAVPADTSAVSNGEQSKAVVSRFMDAEFRGDTAGMSALLADDYLGYGLGVKDSADKSNTLKGVQEHWDVYKYGGKRYARIQAIALATAEDVFQS